MDNALSQSQNAFIAALTDPDRDCPSDLLGKADKRPQKRFNVYRNNVMVSLVEALRGAFPITQRLMGEEFFLTLARDYASHHLPQSPVMFRYGESFPSYLKEQKSLARYPYLADIARLEKARTFAYHAADAQSLTIEALQELGDADFDAVRLTLHPSLHCVPSLYPIVSIWRNETLQQDSPVTLERAETALIIRPEWDVCVYALPSHFGKVLQALADQQTLGAALDNHPLNDEVLGQFLGLLCQTGCITAIDLQS
jgi:hypothetical protein